MVASYPINKMWTFKSKINLFSAAKFDANNGCKLNLTLI